ncbi:MAG: VanZ family protein [Methyloprofundus sp.]|nr:VanZ family protein [Methyloprofundus sp.]
MSDHYIKALDTALLILYCSFIYWLSDQSSLPTPLLFPHQDKLFHAGAYFILAAFTLRAFRHRLTSLAMLLITSLIFSSLYGLSDEWHQSFVPGRMSDIADWMADTLGATLFLAIYYGYRLRCIRESCNA